MSHTRICLVGCGALAQTFYLPVLKKLSFTPAVLADPDLDRIKELAQKTGVGKTAASLEEIADYIDAAIIASPNFLHAPQANYLLRKGKHVLLEKPIAAAENDVKELIEASRQSGAVLQPAMMRRFWKINKAVKKMLEEEVLGKLQTVSMQEGAVMNWPVQSEAIYKKEQSLGGVFIDTGSHVLDLLCWWVGDNRFELKYEDDNRGGVETEAFLSIQFLNKQVMATVGLSRIRKLTNEFKLQGTKGWIKVKPYGNRFEASDRKIEKYIYSLYSARELQQQTFEDLFTEQVSSWLNALIQKDAPAVPVETVLPSIGIIEQAYRIRKELPCVWQ